MMHLITSGILFGQNSLDRFRDMGSGLRGEGAKVDYTELIALGAVLLIVAGFVVVLVKVLAKQDRRAKYNSPKKLFGSLCQAHGLNRGERRLLNQLASEKNLAHPALVFLEPAWFEAGNLGGSMRAHAAPLAAVAKRIFVEQPLDAATEKEAAAVDALIDA